MTTKFIISALIVIVSTATSVRAGDQEKTLFDFDSESSAKGWMPVSDTVMGGVSSSTRRVSDSGTLEFSGTLSLDNNGGFASLRRRMNSVDLSAYDEVMIRVRGDGRRYAFSVQTDYPIMAGTYYFSFETTADNWQEVRAPLSAFEAQSFGRPLLQAPELKARDIRELGFIISDKQEGTFRLEVDWIKAKGAQNVDSRIDAPDKLTAARNLVELAITRGVPLFNAGQQGACAAIYEVTVQSLLALPEEHLPTSASEQLAGALREAARTADDVERAWILRRALDFTLQSLPGSQANPGNEASKTTTSSG